MNKVFLAGNLGDDAELRMTQGGKAVLNFRLATTEKWTDDGGNKQERTEWHRCSMFGPRGEKLAQYLVKGTKLIVEGSIKYGSYEKDGVKRYTTDISVANVEFVGGGKRQDNADNSDDAPPPAPPDESDIPF